MSIDLNHLLCREVLSGLAGRQLVFAGDSMMRQLFARAVSLFRGQVQLNGHCL